MLGAREDGACAVDDECAQVLVALLGYSPEESALTGAEFSGRDTEPGGEVAP